MAKTAKKIAARSVQHAVKQWPLKRLTAYARNSRTHDEKQAAKIARSIERFGFTIPVLAKPDGTIIAGHGRVMAATKLGMTLVPVMVADGWTDEECRAYVIADNQIAAEAGWDKDLLKLELGELKGFGFDLTLTGFDQPAIDTLLGLTVGNTDPDAEVEPPTNPVSRPGDLWTLGDHRIMCGSSTEAEAVRALLDGEAPHLMVTDPPYGVEYDANWRNERARTSVGMGNRAIGAGAVGKVLNDDRADWREAWALFPGDVAYVWHADLRANSVFDSLVAAKFDIRAQIIWVKQQFAIGRGDYHFQHEPCWYAVRKGKRGHWAGDRKQTTRWDIDKPQKSETGHSTQKPVECMQRPMINNSVEGDAIYEPFSGSGTTIIAGQMIGRRVFAMELNPSYVDVAVRRWQDFTGEVAVHSSGATFAKMAAKRKVKL